MRFKEWRNEIPLRKVPIDLEVFKTRFVDSFFSINLRESLLNLRQGGISVKEYTLKFTLLSKNTPTMIAFYRDRMGKFMIKVPNLVEQECQTTILHIYICIIRLMVYAQKTEESKLIKMNRDGTRPVLDDSSQLKSKKKFYNHDLAMGNKNTVSNNNCQGIFHGFERSRHNTC